MNDATKLLADFLAVVPATTTTRWEKKVVAEWKPGYRYEG